MSKAPDKHPPPLRLARDQQPAATGQQKTRFRLALAILCLWMVFLAWLAFIAPYWTPTP